MVRRMDRLFCRRPQRQGGGEQAGRRQSWLSTHAREPARAIGLPVNCRALQLCMLACCRCQTHGNTGCSSAVARRRRLPSPLPAAAGAATPPSPVAAPAPNPSSTHQVESLHHHARELGGADDLEHGADLPRVLAGSNHDLVAAQDLPLAPLKHVLEALAPDAHPAECEGGAAAGASGGAQGGSRQLVAPRQECRDVGAPEEGRDTHPSSDAGERARFEAAPRFRALTVPVVTVHISGTHLVCPVRRDSSGTARAFSASPRCATLLFRRSGLVGFTKGASEAAPPSPRLPAAIRLLLAPAGVPDRHRAPLGMDPVFGGQGQQVRRTSASVVARRRRLVSRRCPARAFAPQARACPAAARSPPPLLCAQHHPTPPRPALPWVQAYAAYGHGEDGGGAAAAAAHEPLPEDFLASGSQEEELVKEAAGKQEAAVAAEEPAPPPPAAEPAPAEEAPAQEDVPPPPPAPEAAAPEVPADEEQAPVEPGVHRMRLVLAAPAASGVPSAGATWRSVRPVLSPTCLQPLSASAPGPANTHPRNVNLSVLRCPAALQPQRRLRQSPSLLLWSRRLVGAGRRVLRPHRAAALRACPTFRCLHAARPPCPPP